MATEPLPPRFFLSVRSLSLLLAVTFGAWLGAAPSAGAQEGERVYLVAVPTDSSLEAVAARVGAASRASLRRIEGIDWRRPDQAYLGYGAHLLRRLQQGREKLDQGRQAYLNLELGEAIQSLSGAVEDFEAAAAALEDPHDLGEALLYLGASQVYANQPQEARDTFERLHVQMPHIEPDPTVFPPDVIQRFQRAAPRDDGNPSASITIESEPPGATAYVDFLPRGTTPLTVDGLVGGDHIVRVSRPGATPFVQEIGVRTGGSEQVNAFLADNPGTEGLAEAVDGLATADLSDYVSGGPVAELAIALEVDKLGIIRVSSADGDRAELHLVMFDILRGRRLFGMRGPVPTGIGSLESGVQQLVSQGLETAFSDAPQVAETETPWDGSGDEQVLETEEDEEVAATEPALWERWWFWAGVGGAVLVGVVITVAVASSGGEDLGTQSGGQIILEF